MSDPGHVEREVKLDADPDLVLPDLAASVPEASVRRRGAVDLDATYYDAADLRLLDRGITVRRRTGEGTHWTVKVPEDLSPGGVLSGGVSPGAPTADAPTADTPALARRETDVVDEATEPPDLVRHLVDPWLAGADLVAVARLVSARDRLDVRPAGSDLVVAEVDDDLVVVFADGHEVGRFREIEIELADGLSAADAATATRLVDAVTDELVAAGARRGAMRPKVDRALAMIGRV